MRSSLIANISRKSLRLSGAARVKHPNGQLTTLVSSDASFLDWASFLVHVVWVQPIQILIGIALLIVNMGWPALIGVAVLVLNTPIQTIFVRTMFTTRQGQLKIVDQRVRLLQEGEFMLLLCIGFLLGLTDAPVGSSRLSVLNGIRGESFDETRRAVELRTHHLPPPPPPLPLS